MNSNLHRTSYEEQINGHDSDVTLCASSECSERQPPEEKLTNSNEKSLTDKSEDINLKTTKQDSKHSCYFIPGKICSKNVQYLLDTGCTRSVLAKHVYDKFPLSIRERLVPNDSQGIMADGSILPVVGKITLPCKVRTEKFEETFIVGKITDDAILGLSFLEQNKCSIHFEKPVLKLNNKEIICVDRAGSQLSTHMQVLQDVSIPASTERAIKARQCNKLAGQIGMVVDTSNTVLDKGLIVANSLADIENNDEILVRCCNIDDTEMHIKTGTVIGSCCTLDESDFYDQIDHKKMINCKMKSKIDHVGTIKTSRPLCSENRNAIIDRPECHQTLPPHVNDRNEQAIKVCETDSDKQAIAELLIEDFADAFNKDNCDIGLANVTQHSIPIVEGNTLIKHLPRRLDPEKGKEVDTQVLIRAKRKRKGPSSRYQPKYNGPYEITHAWDNHMYRIEKGNQASVQHESRLKLFTEATHQAGHAPVILEPKRRPNN